MKRKNFARAIAMLMIICQLTVLLSGCATDNSVSDQTEMETSIDSSEVPVSSDVPAGYYEVRFALPANASAQDAEYTTLPETAIVPQGTKISDLMTPDRISSIFLGWCYDEEQTVTADETDVIDHSMTLYPRFALQDGMDGIGSLTYLSEREVPADFAFEIVSHGLTEEEVRELLSLEDSSLCQENLPIKLELCAKDVEGSKGLSDAEAGLNSATRIVLEQLTVDWETATEEEIKAAYGLEEDDSLQRFWREDAGLSVEDVQALEELLLNRKETGDHWMVRWTDGPWKGGDLYSLTIHDTSRLRFVYKGEEVAPAVVEYNITVHQEEALGIHVASQVEYIPADQVQGVEFLGMLDLQTDEEGNILAKENYRSGVMTYSGGEKLAVGDVIAVHDGAVDERGFTEGKIAYVKITKDLDEGRYAYEHAGLEDILFLADNIPVPDDGSFDDGKITLSASELNFADPSFAKYNLNASTVMEPGDYVSFYKGTLSGRDYSVIGYGLITNITESNGEYQVFYDLVAENEVMEDELLLYMEMPEAEIQLTETDNAALSEQMTREILESGLVEETSDFLTGLIMGNEIDFDQLEHGDELRKMVIRSDEGELSLEDLRLLADGAGTVEVSDVHVTFLGGIDLQHFAGKKGVRAEVAVSFTIDIAIADAGKLEIQPAIVLEQEFLLTPKVKVVRHKNKLGMTSSLDITASLEAGTYSGFGVCVTAKTKNNPNPNADKDWEEMVGSYLYNGNNDHKTLEARTSAAKLLIKGGNKLIDKTKKQNGAGQGQGADINLGDGENKSGKDSKQDYVSPGVGGDLPTKYSNMLSNDAKYINLVNKDLGSADFPIDPMGIIHCGLKINFVVALKINAMIGSGLTYENAKVYSYSFRAKIWGGGDEGENLTSGSSVKDLATPNFRVDFYAFGMVGLRIGVSIDLRVGIFSTDLDSVGVVASAGVYAELYGFLYCWYEWTSGQGSTNGAMGSLLFEVGIYTDISVKVQVGAGKASKSWSLYGTKTPLLQLGCAKYPIDFVIKPNDKKLDLTFSDGENTVKVPDELFQINLMALSSGKLSAENMDSRHVCETDAKSFTATVKSGLDALDNGGITLSTSRSWTQYNEDHFVVECFDLESDKGKVKEGPSSFQYLPATDEIFVNPIDRTAKELWGKVVFTYKNNAFGFSTQKLQRTVYVHWTGKQQTAIVEYYLQDNSTREAFDSGYQWTKAGTGNVTGYDGIRCYVDVTPELVNLFPGYRFAGMKLPDEEELREKFEAAEKAFKGASNAMMNANIERNAKSDAETEAKFKKASDRYMQAKAVYDLCYELYARYYDNNQEVFRNLSGTTYFTMRGATTVIRVYFKKEDINTAWLIVKEGDATVLANDGSSLLKGVPIMDVMPETMRNYSDDNYTLQWYVYTYQGNFQTEAEDWVARNITGGELQWFTPLSDGMLPPASDNCVVVGLLSPKEFTVHWKVGDTEYATTKVRHGNQITVPEDVPGQTGYDFLFWAMEDGTRVTNSDNVSMPVHDLILHAVFFGQTHNVTWITDDGYQTNSVLRTGEGLYDHVPEDVKKEGSFYIWRTNKQDYSTELSTDYVMPGSDLTVYGRRSQSFATITWVGDTTISVKTEIGKAPVRPALMSREGYDLAWILDDGTAMQDNFVMPDHDVKATAYWHVHKWVVDASSVIPATCNATGSAGLSCELCGLIGGKALDIDPNNHDWTDFVIKKATCSEEGVMGHRCLRCGAENTTPIAINPEEHTHISLINEKKETCGEDGYTGDRICDACKNIVERGSVIPATGNHTTGGIYAEKEATCKTQGYEGHYCIDCNQIVIDKVLPLVPDNHTWSEAYEVTKEPTCGEDGTARYICNECGESKTEPIPATGEHNWDEKNYVVLKHSTCSAMGEGQFHCTVCGAIKTSHLDRDLDRHVALGEAQILADPDCENDGLQRRECGDCGRFVFETIPALGHNWTEVTYDWSADHLHVTAAKRCLRNSDHDMVETVRADAKVVKLPTCTESGETVYTTRAFEYYPELFGQQKKSVITKAIGHIWGQPVYEWSEDLGTVTATRTCENDASHVETETVSTTNSVTKAPTVYEKGETTYTALFENEAFGTQTKTVASIDSLDPDWNAASFEWSQNLRSVKATRISRIDPSLVETEAVETTSVRTKAPSCEEAGEITYTAVFANVAFGTQTKKVSVDPIDHDWQLSDTINPKPLIRHVDHEWGGWDECTGWEAGSRIYTCSHDGSHIYSEPIKVSLGLASYYSEESGNVNSIVINLGEILDDYEMTLEEFLGGMTVGDLIERWAMVYPYTAANQGWWLEGYADEELASALRQYSLEGDYVYKDSSQKQISVTDYEGQSLTVELTYMPLEAETFEKLENIYITILWPDTMEHTHVWGDWEIGTAPNCTEGGTEVRRCANCSETQTRPIAALNHDLVHHAAKPATCTEKGWEAYDTCSRCDYTTYREIVASGHKPKAAVVENNVEPGCLTAGSYDKVIYCETCGEELGRETVVVAASGHDWAEPSWIWEGNTAAEATFTCKHNDSHTQTIRADILETATGHLATVAFNGKTYTNEKDDKIVLKLGSEWETESHDPGLELAYLSFLQSELAVETLEELSPEDLTLWAYVGEGITAENRVDVNAVLTWGENYTEVKLADIRIGDTFRIHIKPENTAVYAESDAILMVVHEHEWTEATNTATCTADGVLTYICQGCGEEKTEVSSALGHDYQLAESVGPQPILKYDEEAACYECIGWEAGSNTYVCSHDGSHSYTETVKVPTAIFSMAGDRIVINGNSVAIDLGKIVEESECTLDFYVQNSGLTTVGDIINCWLGVLPYNADTYGWWLEDFEDPAMRSALNLYQLKIGSEDDRGSFVYEDSSLAEVELLDGFYQGGSLTLKLSFVPKDSDVFETIANIEITISWPPVTLGE